MPIHTSPFIYLTPDELPRYAKYAVSYAKAATPSNYELEITKYLLKRHNVYSYWAHVGKYREDGFEGLVLTWREKDGKPFGGNWDIEFASETFPAKGKDYYTHEICFVKGELGGIIGKLEGQYAESRK